MIPTKQLKVPYLLLKPLRIFLSVGYALFGTAGKLLRINQEYIQRIYIGANNSITKSVLQKAYHPGEILVLLPRCLQPETCPSGVIIDISECRGCGACTIVKTKELAHRGFNVRVVSGGTAARQEIKKQRPALIVAVACENELYQGIKGVLEYPVFGIVNQRPHGPCRRTTFSLEQLELLLTEYTTNEC